MRSLHGFWILQVYATGGDQPAGLPQVTTVCR
jgi:hypothetical protein